jgi:hypothetical protein
VPVRFRPIMMTTMAALVDAADRARLRRRRRGTRPLGLAVVGGLLVSQLLTLTSPRSTTCHRKRALWLAGGGGAGRRRARSAPGRRDVHAAAASVALLKRDLVLPHRCRRRFRARRHGLREDLGAPRARPAGAAARRPQRGGGRPRPRQSSGCRCSARWTSRGR